MVSFAEAAALPPDTRNKRIRCHTREWIDALPETERDAARALLLDNRRHTTDLFPIFVENGYQHNYDALVKHRGKRCSCPR